MPISGPSTSADASTKDGDAIPVCASADPATRAPGFAVPEGACDCHAHVFDGLSGLVEPRTYTPAPSPFSAYRAMLETLGFDRGVIVQPSVYGTDNRQTLAAVSQGGSSFRAIVVVNQDVVGSELQRLRDQGARGARANLLFLSDARVGNLQQLARSVSEVGWHLQLLADVTQIADLEGVVSQLPVPVVFDHLGHIPATPGVQNPGFQALLRLLGAGRVWVKLSGAYRITGAEIPPYSDVTPFAQALVASNPDQLVWGSDWPHPMIPVPMPNDGDLIDMLPDWSGNEENLQKILVDNPERLYGFD